jgi:1-deoxy-D-xylulose-5-phosphate synthase
MADMIQVFREVKPLDRPVVIHVITRKGKGYELAEEDPARFHGVSPLKVKDGKVETRPVVSFTEAFSTSLVSRAFGDPRVVGITAAMAKGTGLEDFRAACPGRVYDVGIAEEHAVTFAAGLAAGGLKPVVAMYSTFVQRAVDQILHDSVLQGRSLILALDRAGAVGEDGETHQGLYDIALLRSFPGIQILAPASAADLDLALGYALGLEGSTLVIRYPKARCPREEESYSEAWIPGRGSFVRRSGADCLIVAMGGLVAPAVEASDLLLREGRPTDVYNLRFVAPLDEEAFLEAAAGYRRLLFLEEGCQAGGLGESLAGLIARRLPRLSFTPLGFPSNPFPQASREELMDRAGFSVAGIAERVRLANAEDDRIYLFGAVSGNR